MLLSLIKEILSVHGIRQIGILHFSACRVIHPSLLERSNLSPKSVIIIPIPYFTGIAENRNLSLYAISRDYHGFASSLSASLLPRLSEAFPENRFVFFCDHSPIDERSAAAASGLGVIGDHGLLIHPQYGSYLFLCELLTDLDLGELGAPQEIKGCLHCGKCDLACPSKEECLSAITQRKGDLTAKEAALMRQINTAWGCDCCQLACPLNKHAEITPIPYFHADRLQALTHKDVSAMEKAEFATRAFAWRGKKTILRNLAILEGTEEP